MNDAPSNGEVLRLSHLTRAYVQGTTTLEVFRDISLTLRAGELVALVGPSGAGKSSLLHMAGLLEAPTSGEVIIEGTSASLLPDIERTRLRRDRIGFVYQAHHLLPEFSALENVAMPQMIAGRARAVAEERARQLLSMVGLESRLVHRPGELSGGEQQRVAIARALANSPRILLADEPTGNLDPGTAGGVFDILLKTVRAEGLAALVATHNYDLAKRMDRSVLLDRGALREGAVA
jgi:lipoprotein-releasing system ATP-binding protein